MVEMELTKIVIRETAGQQYIFLREKGGAGRTFPIVIGYYEADVINRKVLEQQTARPLTHDLAGNLITALGGRLDRIVVSQLKHNTFYAHLLIEQNGSTIEVDSRPSDAIALAVQAECPIFVAEEVLEVVALQ